MTFTREVSPTLLAYSDASRAGCPYTRKSTSGRVILYGGTPISWPSKLQRAIATSSTESEIYALTETLKETLYLRLLLEDLRQTQREPTTLLCDNMATISICSGRDQQLKRVRHLRELKRFLDVRRRFIQSQNAEIKIIHCTALNNVADPLTKPLGPKKMDRFRRQVLK